MNQRDTNPVITRVARSALIRKTYAICRQIPILGSYLHRRVLKVLPQESRIWVRVPRGPGKDLWILADPRFDPDYCNGEHEAWVQDLLCKDLGEGDCFYDVGAHIGFFSLIAARVVGPTGCVTAFEPDPGNTSVFRANRERNRMSQIEVVEAAVWASSGLMKFELSNKLSGGMEGRVTEDTNTISDVIEVMSISLDDYIFEQKGKPPNFIKIDVEGGESAVLSGALGALNKFKPRLLCEIHSPSVAGPLKDLLARFGYSIKDFPSAGKSYVWAVSNT